MSTAQTVDRTPPDATIETEREPLTPRRRIPFGARLHRDLPLLIMAVPGIALLLVFH